MSYLQVSDLSVRFGESGVLDGVSFELAKGERVALIGESGSGKTMTAYVIAGLLPAGARATGRISLDGTPVLGRPDREVARLRGTRMALVFQEPGSALDPLMRAGRQIALATRLRRAAARTRTLELLKLVELEPGHARAYPHQLSGGQCQRVLLAIALARDPGLLICDEPTSALDASVQARILDLIRRICDSMDMTLLFISHDLAAAAGLCDRVLVLHQGGIVEDGPAAEVFARPGHPYTRTLLAASDLTALRPRGQVGTEPEAEPETVAR